MRFLSIFLLLAVMLSVPLTSSTKQSSSVLPNIDTAAGFQEVCSWVERSREGKATPLEALGAGECIGWINGFTTGIRAAEVTHNIKATDQLVCYPEGNNFGQMIHIIEKYVRDHPEKEHLPTSVLAGTALAEAFPCH